MTMTILQALEPPRPATSPRKPLTYGSRVGRKSNTNPASPFKSPLPREADISPATTTMSLEVSPKAPSSELSSPPPLIGRSSDKPSWSPSKDAEESMEVESNKSEDHEGDEREEESEEESIHDDRPIVHIEARIKYGARCLPHVIEANLKAYLSEVMWITSGDIVDGWDEIDCLAKHLESVVVAEISSEENTVSLRDADLEIHVYRMSYEKDSEIAGQLSEDEDESNHPPAAASTKSLPSEDLEELWGNLVYPDNLKERLLQYIYSSMFFSEKEVSSGVVNWSRLVLLHGPPGTGKTSLCRALAQKIAIRLQPEYQSTKIVEINSHSLFSKWFSESGKLVQKLFSHVTDMADSDSNFIIVMIDEVESLTGSRSQGGAEPGDALRVVNAVLTQLDKLRTRDNVLVLTTSNLSHAIDNAFIDRADIKEFVPLPPPEAIYWMLRSCFLELMDKEAMKHLEVPKWLFANRGYTREKEGGVNGQLNGQGDIRPSKEERSATLGIGLARLAHRCHEYKLSGRVLRRMPMMAHTRYLGRQKRSASTAIHKAEKWLEAMEKFVEVEQMDREKIGWDKEAMAS